MTLNPASKSPDESSNVECCDSCNHGSCNHGSAGDAEFESRPLFEIFERDVTAERIFEAIDPMSLLREFIESVPPNAEIAKAIKATPHFAEYHAQFVKHKIPVGFRGNNVWLVPSYDAKKNRLKAHKWNHVSLLCDGWSCDCNERSPMHEPCIHIILVQLIERFENPTSLIRCDKSKLVTQWSGVNSLLQLEYSDKQRCSSVFSVDCPVHGGNAIVHINQSAMCISCSLCPSAKWCSHRKVVNEYVFEVTGGEIDVAKELSAARNPKAPDYDAKTGDLSVFDCVTREKDLSSRSKLPIPVPRFCYVDADEANEELDAEYYTVTPLELREYPSELKPKSTHCAKCSSEYHLMPDVLNASYYNSFGRYTVDIYKNVCAECGHVEVCYVHFVISTYRHGLR